LHATHSVAVSVLADVDPNSPERGRLFSLRVEWNPERHLLAIRPVRGIALHRNRRYAAALTTLVDATDGSPLAASESFHRVRSRRSAEDAATDHARVVLAPALGELERRHRAQSHRRARRLHDRGRHRRRPRRARGRPGRPGARGFDRSLAPR
jgi:hypothetical protein